MADTDQIRADYEALDEIVTARSGAFMLACDNNDSALLNAAVNGDDETILAIVDASVTEIEEVLEKQTKSLEEGLSLGAHLHAFLHIASAQQALIGVSELRRQMRKIIANRDASVPQRTADILDRMKAIEQEFEKASAGASV